MTDPEPWQGWLQGKTVKLAREVQFQDMKFVELHMTDGSLFAVEIFEGPVRIYEGRKQ